LKARIRLWVGGAYLAGLWDSIVNSASAGRGAKVANISCPVYGFYGENDERVNATIPKAEELMKAAQEI